MDSDNYVVSDTGVMVWKTPEAHPLLRHTDTTHPVILAKLTETYSRGRVRGLPRILSENSEDACTWHYFSPLLRDRREMKRVIEKLMHHAFPEGVSPQVLDAIQYAEITLWPKLSPPPSRPQRERDSEPDVLIRMGNQGLVLVEAKYHSDVSRVTKHDRTRDQVIRLIDVGAWRASQENMRDRDSGGLNSYVIVLQYGNAQIDAAEVVGQYKGDPEAIETSLPYRSDLTACDFQRLARSVAYIQWPDPMNQ